MVSEYEYSLDFEKKEVVNEYKYIVITKGDLDINNAAMLKDKDSVKLYLEEKTATYEDVIAVIEIGNTLEFEIEEKLEVTFKDEN